jgi:hypothetical protein
MGNGWKALEIRNKSHVEQKKSFGMCKLIKIGLENSSVKHIQIIL